MNPLKIFNVYLNNKLKYLYLLKYLYIKNPVIILGLKKNSGYLIKLLKNKKYILIKARKENINY